MDETIFITASINLYAKGMQGVLDGSSGIIKLKTTINNVQNSDKSKKLIEAYKKIHDKFLFGYDKSLLPSLIKADDLLSALNHYYQTLMADGKDIFMIYNLV